MKAIVTHAHCVDGYLSALILGALYPEATVIRRKYTDPKLDLVEDAVFCDIAPPRGQARAFFEAGAVVLDHHRSALPVFSEPAARGRYSATPGESGAVLALQYAYEHGWVADREVCRAVEDIATLVGVYDTWQTSSPSFETASALHAGLEALMDDASWTLDKIARDYAFVTRLGEVLYGKTKERAKRAAERAVVKRVAILGVPTTVGILTDNVSTGTFNLAANLVDADVVLAASFDSDVRASAHEDTVESLEGAQIRCSLRSRAGYDCAGLAEAFGGGGHRGAAGFSVDRRHLVRPVQVVLDAFLQKGVRL